MPLSFTTTMPGACPDYEKYLWEKPVKVDRHKDFVLFDFTLVPWGSDFVKIKRGSWIKFDTSTYGVWFTGYVINEPELEYVGSYQGDPVWGYRYEATSDPYILSLKPLGFIPPFLNMTMGAIIKALINLIAPGMFDLSWVQDGPLVAQYTVDPNKKFIDIAQEFCESASFVFGGIDKKIYFQPQDFITGGFTLDGNNKHFTPARLTISPSKTPILNDVTVVGGVEPQTYVHEYFLGTGIDAAFPLIAGVYGADTTVLIDEQFSGGGIDSSTWDVFDKTPYALKVDSGYLNSLGGSANGSFDVRIQSVSPIPMDGRLRFTHGEWDFVLSTGSGVIASLWTQTPNSAYTGCLYGLRYNNGVLTPIVSGTEDGTQSFTVDTTKRYVIRTIAEFAKTNRASQTYSYLDNAGEVQQLSAQSVTDDSVLWHTLITEVDPSNGSIVQQATFTNSATLNSTQLFANYAPLISNDLHATVTGITVSVPISATLEMAGAVRLKNLGFDSWSSDTTPAGWDNPTGVLKETAQASSVACMKMSRDSSVAKPMVEQDATQFLTEPNKYTISAKIKRSSGLVGGTTKVRFVFYGTGLSETGLEVSFGSISSSAYQTYSATVNIATVPNDLKFKIEFVNGGLDQYVFVDDVSVYSDWKLQLVGPNEIDAMDGLAPVATVVSSNQGAETKSTYLGTPQLNPGQAQLVFFKDSLTRTSNTPPENQLFRFSYRAAGPAVGRSLNRTSINDESVYWGDDGVRSIVRSDLSPRPRTSEECEMAAAAVVAENAFQHYEGSYEQWSDYFTEEPRAGAIITFQNISGADNLQAEEIMEVRTTLESKSPVERFRHQITFGKPDRIRRLLAQFESAKGSFQKPQTGKTPVAVDSLAVGLSYAPDLPKPKLLNWDDNYIYMDVGPGIADNTLGFEVRYTDEGWGVDDGKNLIVRQTLPQFQVPRDLRGKTFFIRQAVVGNLLKWSEDQARNDVYAKTNCTVAMVVDYNPDRQRSLISKCSMGYGAKISAAITVSGFYGAFSFSVRGPAGKVVTAKCGSSTLLCKLSGGWQRFTVTAPGGSISNVSIEVAEPMDLYTTRWSVESGTQVERMYARTTDNLYGPVSRYATAVHVSFPVSSTSETTGPVSSPYIEVPHNDATGCYNIDLQDGGNFRIVLDRPSFPLENAGLESGDLTGWTPDLPDKASVDTDVYQGSGGYSLKMEDDAASWRVWQLVEGLTEGEDYWVFAWVRGDAGGAAQARLRIGDSISGGIVEVAATPDETWQLLGVKFTATSTLKLRINLFRDPGAGNIYWDNVSVGPLVVAPTYSGGVIRSGMQFTLFIDQDATGGHMAPMFSTGPSGFVGSVNGLGISGDKKTRSSYIFTYHGTVWGVTSFRTGDITN